MQNIHDKNANHIIICWQTFLEYRISYRFICDTSLFHNMIVKGLGFFLSYLTCCRLYKMHSITYKFNLHRMHIFTHKHIQLGQMQRKSRAKLKIVLKKRKPRPKQRRKKNNPNAFHDADT